MQASGTSGDWRRSWTGLALVAAAAIGVILQVSRTEEG
jgi:hypothetical protein